MREERMIQLALLAMAVMCFVILIYDRLIERRERSRDIREIEEELNRLARKRDNNHGA